MLIAGGTLALACSSGICSGIVSLTRGERGPIAPGSLRAGETLAEARERELHASARALGAGWARCLRHPDGEVGLADADVAATELVELLRPHVPAVLLTFGPDGLYGHPDHLATRTIVALAASRLEDAAVLEAVWRPGLVAELVAAAAARGLPVGLWDLEAADFGVARSTAIEIDGRSVIDRKLRALDAHRTQFAADHLLAALPRDLAERFLGVEAWAGSAGAAARLRELLGSRRAERERSGP